MILGSGQEPAEGIAHFDVVGGEECRLYEFGTHWNGVNDLAITEVELHKLH